MSTKYVKETVFQNYRVLYIFICCGCPCGQKKSFIVCIWKTHSIVIKSTKEKRWKINSNQNNFGYINCLQWKFGTTDVSHKSKIVQTIHSEESRAKVCEIALISLHMFWYNWKFNQWPSKLCAPFNYCVQVFPSLWD